ncbi:MAG: chemotaxis protein CheC [Geobacteraceae bacterium]|nr:chemotaxis protein CheC [Geobacteraceae bacterium]
MNLTELQLDAFKELVNIGVGRAAASLNDMLDSHIMLEVPEVRMLDFDDMTGVTDNLAQDLSCVQLGFYGSFTGMAALVFPPPSAVQLVSALTGEDATAPGLDGLIAGTLNEVGNIVINCVIGTIGNILERPLDFSLPNYLQGQLGELLKMGDDDQRKKIILVRTHFTVLEKQLDGNIFLMFEAASFDALLLAIEQIHAR